MIQKKKIDSEKSQAQETALAMPDTKTLAEIRETGGSSGTGAPSFPQLRLEHTLDINGDPNPIRGKFSISRPNVLGEWDKTAVGEEMTARIVLQRYFLNLMKEGKKYSSREFDSEKDQITLFEVTGQGSDRKASMYAEGTPYDLGKLFLVKDAKGRTYTELSILYVLYLLVGKELVKWRMNRSSTFSYRGYQRRVTPFIVMTKVTREEKKTGNNKFYVPKFEAVEMLKNFTEILEQQQQLRELITLGRASFDIEGNEEKPLGDLEEAVK